LMSLLALVVVLGVSAAGSVAIVRAILMDHWPALLLEKPWSCSLCLSWWSSVALVIFALVSGRLAVLDAPLAVLASTAVSLAFVRGSNRLSE